MTAYPDITARWPLYVGIGLAILGASFLAFPRTTTLVCVASTVWVLRGYVPGESRLPMAWVRRRVR